MRVESNGKLDHDALYEKYFHEVYRTAFSYSGNHHIAEEIAQNAFMKLYVNEKTVPEGKELFWLKLVAKREALNYRRDTAKEILSEDIHVEYEDKLRVQNAEDEYIGLLREQELKNLKEEIFSDMEQKNEMWHKAMKNVYEDQRPQKEVAEEMDVSLTSLQSVLKRARKWVKKDYNDKYKDLRKT